MNQKMTVIGLGLLRVCIVFALVWAWLGPSPARSESIPSIASAPIQMAPKQQVSPRIERNKRKAVSKKIARKPLYKAPLHKARTTREIRPSLGQLAGLRTIPDHLDLKSSVAFVVDQDTKEVLFSKNDQAVLPIASITKLMTGLIIRQASLDMDEQIVISDQDVDTQKGSSSRLRVGSSLSRDEMLHLALMSSENRAAHSLGRTYPGGLSHFVQLMNRKAVELGMKDTRFIDPTGLSSRNQSSARDLAVLVAAASEDSLLREYSTTKNRAVEVGHKTLQYRSTNRLVSNPNWDIGLQKTGYISEAGQCLVMQAQIAGRTLIMVFLDSASKLGRLGDAERIRHWLESSDRQGGTGI